MRRVLMAASIALLIGPIAAHAKIGDWKNYTDMKNVIGLVATGNAVWAGTTGGMLRFIPGDSTFLKFTNSEGLTGNDVNAIGVDSRASIWVGENSGAIDIYSPATNSWKYINDVELSTQSHKAINAFFPYGDTMYIATAFGISVFSLKDFDFGDSYENIGLFSHPSVTCLTIENGRIFVGTSQGVSVSQPNAKNLPSPDSWTSYTTPAEVTALAVYRNNVYAGTTTGVYEFQDSSWTAVPSLGQAVTALVSGNSFLYVFGLNNALTLSSNGTVSSLGDATPANISCALADSSGKIFVGMVEGGIGVFNAGASTWSQFAPNGPMTSVFASIAIDANGVLWAASVGAGGSGAGRGFYSFDGKTWRNYNTATEPILTTNEFFSVSLGPNNSKWIGSWGEGVALVDGNGNIVREFNHSYPGFVGVVTDTVVVIGKIGTDPSGNVWVPVYDALNGNVLWRMKPDSTWGPIRAPSSTAYGDLLGITVDRNGTKWCSNTISKFQPQPAHFVYYNESVPVQGLAGDGWGEATVSNGFASQSITNVVEDKDGALWVGTDLGVTIINDPAYPISQNSTVFLGAVRDQFINTIVVDPLNDKWLGTHTGVVVVSSDGSSLIAQYNVANTNGKLVDNDVLSIALDEKKGIAYFGTESGLSSLEIPVIETVEKMTTLEVGPNPFIIPDQPSVSIKGLTDNASIKVLNIAGSLVKEFAAQGGGRAFWDGTDTFGKTVGTGVYLIVAYATNGSQVATAKVAVIRR